MKIIYKFSKPGLLRIKSLQLIVQPLTELEKIPKIKQKTNQSEKVI